MRIRKYWKSKAKSLSVYVRDEYNQDRALIATIGSAGILTFPDDLKMLELALRDFGDSFLADLIKNKDWMYRCGTQFPKVLTAWDITQGRLSQFSKL